MKRNLNEIFENQPLSNEAPQGLRNRVEIAARQRVRAPWFAVGSKWVAIGTAAAAMLFFAATSLMPTKAEAKTWDMVSNAYKEVKGILMRINIRDEDGGSDITIASKGQEWRVAVGESNNKSLDISYSNGELTIWEGGDTAQVMSLGMQLPFSPEEIVKQVANEISISKLLEKSADEIGRENIRVEQPVTVDGRRVYNVYVTNIHGGGKAHMVVDAESDLPLTIEFTDQDGDSGTINFDFNAEFDDSLLRPILPSGIKFEHMDIGKMMEGMPKDGMKDFGKDFSKGMDFDFDFGDHQKQEAKIEPAKMTL